MTEQSEQDCDQRTADDSRNLSAGGDGSQAMSEVIEEEFYLDVDEAELERFLSN